MNDSAESIALSKDGPGREGVFRLQVLKCLLVFLVSFLAFNGGAAQTSKSISELQHRFEKIESNEDLLAWVQLCESQEFLPDFAIEFGIPQFQKINRHCLKLAGNLGRTKETIFVSIYYYTTPDETIPDWKLKQLSELTRLLNNETAKTSKQFLHVILDLRDLYNSMELYAELTKLAPLFREFGNKDLGEEGVEHQILADLSIVYYRLGNYKKAIEVYHQQAPYTKGLYGIHESSRLNNLGLCHMELKENDSALYFFNRALIKCEELIEKEQSEEELRNLISFQYVVKANIADVLVQSGDYRDAQKTYEAQLQYSHKEWYPHLVLSSYLSLAKLQYEQADLKKAELYLDSLEVQHRKTPYLRYYVQALQLRHDIYLEQGNRREANEAMVLWKHIQDSLDYVKSQREYQVSAVRFETDLTQRQLMVTQSDLNKEKELNRYQSIGLILAILLVVVFLFGYRVLRKKNRLLFQQQSELSLALGERELLLKEVHHRVKNNLNIVIAILRNQSNKFRDNNTQPLFSNASSFIMSMSKIHEFLYNQDNFSKVDMDSYLDSILLEFGGTYRNKNVQLKLTHGGVRLNVDQAQALSILLCELIINSMKYAFSEKGGSIEIALMQTDGDNCHFQYQDSGSGFDLKNSKPSTFGIRLIQMTTEQLHGQLKLLTDGIFKVNIVFPIR